MMGRHLLHSLPPLLYSVFSRVSSGEPGRTAVTFFFERRLPLCVALFFLVAFITTPLSFKCTLFTFALLRRRVFFASLRFCFRFCFRNNAFSRRTKFCSAYSRASPSAFFAWLRFCFRFSFRFSFRNNASSRRIKFCSLNC